jgi:hypothetical protein
MFNRKFFKERQMKITFHILLTMGLLLLIGCQTGLTKSEGISDAELIQAIIDADKIEISMEQLPGQSRTVMEQDYYDYMGIAAKKATGLGYEVDLAGVGHRFGDRNEVYFNLEGRRLDPNDYGRDKDGWDRDGDDKKDWKCFNLVFPVTFDMPDGSTITVTSNDEDGWAEIKAWYETNPDSEEKPALQYPVDIVYEDDDEENETTVTINNDDEMRGAYRRCGGRDDDKDRACFALVYPVTFIMPDGSTITVADREDWAELKAWYETNPDAEERPTLQYPVDITYRDGTTQTINNDEEMRIAKEDCRDEDEDRP